MIDRTRHASVAAGLLVCVFLAGSAGACGRRTAPGGEGGRAAAGGAVGRDEREGAGRDAPGPGRGSALDAILERHPLRPILGTLALPREGKAARESPAGSPPPAALRFLVGGHLYGRPGRRTIEEPGPAPSLRRAIPSLRAMHPDFFVSLGDFVWAFVDPYLSATLAELGKLGVPVLNAPGNHDVGIRGAYEARFGTRWGAARAGKTVLVVLDTEEDPWQVPGAQLEMLRGVLREGPAAGVRNVFVFAHKLVFAAEDPRYRVLFEHGNARDGWQGTSNFARDLRPALASCTKAGGEVWWFGGDVGAPGSYGLFQDRDPRTGVHYVATGLGETEADNVVLVTVSPGGDVRLERIPLAEGGMPPLEACGLAAWRERFRGGV